jgi:hypothetical protein
MTFSISPTALSSRAPSLAALCPRTFPRCDPLTPSASLTGGCALRLRAAVCHQCTPDPVFRCACEPHLSRASQIDA